MAQTEKLGDGKSIKPRMRHIPYHACRILAASHSATERIRTDEMIGLGTVGRAGYIYNDGPGDIEIQIFDGTVWSDWITIATGDGLNIYYEDNIWMDTIKVRTGRVLGANYELVMNPGLERGGEG